MNTAHTPGPWIFRGKSNSVHQPSATHPYGKTIFRFDETNAPSDGDLALILSAPELLAALIALNAVASVEEDKDYAAVANALAAIAKATGVSA